MPARSHTASARGATRRVAPLLVLALAAGTIAAPASVSAADTGTVEATVTVQAAACIQLSASQITFGSLPLGAEDQPATPAVIVTNCSTSPATLLARATDATSGAVTWDLVDIAATCQARCSARTATG